jgi:nucleotide-binding universal stress UspA family protein
MPMWPPRKILCPTDFSEGSRTAISQATEMAKQFRAAIYLLHAISMQAPPLPTDPGYSFDMLETSKILDEQARKNLQEAAEQLKNAGLTTRPIVVIGDAATAIVETAEREQVDLIVIATYGKTGWRRLAFGSVTEKVVRLATCPVLTIRGNVQ